MSLKFTSEKNRLPEKLIDDMLTLPPVPARPLRGEMGTGFARVAFPLEMKKHTNWPWVWTLIPTSHKELMEKGRSSGSRYISPEAYNVLIKHFEL